MSIIKKAIIVAIAIPLCLILIILSMIAGIAAVVANSDKLNTTTTSEIQPYPDEVLRWRPAVVEACSTYGLDVQYVELVLAVMAQESGGNGLDPMQASESGYNTLYPNEPGGIQDPQYSIECGVQVIRDVLTAAGVTDCQDFVHIPLALQSYNYGGGYLTWAVENYGGYSMENAVEFSEMKKQELGWDVYGDPEYVPHVLRYYLYYTDTAENNYIMPILGDYTIGRTFEECQGIELIAPAGTEVVVMSHCTIIEMGSNEEDGLWVSAGDDYGFEVRYCHLQDYTDVVGSGNILVQGQVIGHVGQSGNASQPMLFLQIYDLYDPVDPAAYLPLNTNT